MLAPQGGELSVEPLVSPVGVLMRDSEPFKRQENDLQYFESCAESHDDVKYDKNPAELASQRSQPRDSQKPQEGKQPGGPYLLSLQSIPHSPLKPQPALPHVVLLDVE